MLHDPVTSRTSQVSIMAHQFICPKPFDGTEDVDDFFHSFDCYLSFTNWPEDKKYSALKGMLREQAARWLQRQDLEELNTYDLLKDAVQQQYRPQPAMQFRIRQKLLNRKQATRESVNAYADDIRQLCFKLNITDEDSIMHQFIQGLRPNVKRQVLRSQPEDLEAAIGVAEAEETAQKVEEEDCAAGEVANLATRVANILAVKQTAEGVRCQLCSMLGHEALDCPTFQVSQSRRSRRKDRSQIQCYSCGQWGHYARECNRQSTYGHSHTNQGNAQSPTQRERNQHQN